MQRTQSTTDGGKSRRWGAKSTVAVGSTKQTQKRGTRYFTDRETDLLLRAAKKHGLDVYVVFRVGLALGCRVGELLTIRVADWNFDRGDVKIIDSKKHTPRFTPFLEEEGSEIQMYIEERELSGDGLMFQMSSKTYTRWVKKIAREVGITWDNQTENVRWHSFRGTFVRRYLRQGMDIQWISEVLGDHPLTILKFYSIRTRDDNVTLLREKVA